MSIAKQFLSMKDDEPFYQEWYDYQSKILKEFMRLIPEAKIKNYRELWV